MVLGAIISLFEFILTFWIGIILILIVNAILEKQPIEAASIKQKSIVLLQPTARVLLLHIILVVIGFVLLIIPGFIALVWFAFAQTAVILDDQRGKQALLFSKSLSEGRFWRVLYSLITGPIIIGFIYSMIVAVIFSIGGSASGFDPTNITPETQIPGWIELFASILEIFAIPWLATYMVMLYKELRGTKDVSPIENDKIPEGEHEASPLQPHSNS